MNANRLPSGPWYRCRAPNSTAAIPKASGPAAGIPLKHSEQQRWKRQPEEQLLHDARGEPGAAPYGNSPRLRGRIARMSPIAGTSSRRRRNSRMGTTITRTIPIASPTRMPARFPVP